MAHTRDVQTIADAILRYLDDHPEAADTAEWIGRWWIVCHGIEAPLENVQTALDQLVDAGRVSKDEVLGQAAVYARNARG
jgi:hypothetical protein